MGLGQRPLHASSLFTGLREGVEGASRVATWGAQCNRYLLTCEEPSQYFSN